jgi:hypothetical protein
MKIAVINKHTQTAEELDIKFPVELSDRGKSFNILKSADGMDYYFYKETGFYDGWGTGNVAGMDLEDPTVSKLISNIESQRKIAPPTLPVPGDN